MSKKKVIVSVDDMAGVYAGIISCKRNMLYDYPFNLLNALIIAKWGKTQLRYIKKKAWAIIDNLSIVEKEIKIEQEAKQ